MQKKCVFISLGRQFGGIENYLPVIIDKWIEEGNTAIIIVRKNSLFEKKVREKYDSSTVFSAEISISSMLSIRNEIKKYKPDVININGVISGFFYDLMQLNNNVVTTVHGNAEMDRIERPWLIRKVFILLENHTLKNSSQIIIVSKALEEVLRKRGIDNKKIKFIGNGVKPFNYENKKLRICTKDPLRIMYAGRLEIVKGCEYLIRAISECKEENIQLDIYGEGSLREELTKLATDLGVNSIISFKGFSNKVREEMNEYHVIVIPSLFEAFPLTIPEAMNAKVLVVCSDAGGMPFIVENEKTGYVFKKQNYLELSQIIKKIINDPESCNRMVEESLTLFYQEYTEEIMSGKTVQLLSCFKR